MVVGQREKDRIENGEGRVGERFGVSESDRKIDRQSRYLSK